MRIVETFRCDFSSRRRDELFTNATSSDDERRRDAGGIRRPRTETPGFNVKKRPSSGGITGPAASSGLSAASVPSSAIKKILDRKADLNKSSVASGTVAAGRKTKFTKKISTVSEKNAARLPASTILNSSSAEIPTTNGKDIKVKKTYRKRKPSEKVTTPAAERRLAKKASRRKSQTTINNTTDSDADSDGGAEEEEIDDVDRSAQHLRSWIDQYEEAVTNHYSPELRARLSGNKFAGLGNELRTSVIGGPTRCNVSLKGNGVKVFTSKIQFTKAHSNNFYYWSCILN